MHLSIPIRTLKPLVIMKYGGKIDSPDTYLASSISLETACTFCLSNVNNNKLWYIPIYTGYGMSFYLFPKCLNKYSLSTAYTLWSGFGIILTLILDLLLKREVFKFKKLLGIFVVVYGISMIK